MAADQIPITMKTTYRDIVCAVIVSRDNKILMSRKHPLGGGVYVNCWQLPGGGIEEGETHEQALRRELLEETGLDTGKLAVSLLSDTDSDSATKKLESGEIVLCQMKFFVYLIPVNLNHSEIPARPGADLAQLAWYSRSELAHLHLVPAGVRLFDLYGDQIFNFWPPKQTV